MPISSWKGLPAQDFRDLPLMILKLELDNQGDRLVDKPSWLLTTAITLEPETIARAYLGRASQELSFRLMKQPLGLSNSPELKSWDAWFQLVALAMNLLLPIRDDLKLQAKPCYPLAATKAVSQRQAQTQAPGFFLKFPNLTLPPQPAGKASGRPLGYQPPPRTRHKVLPKTPKPHKPCPSCPFNQPA